MKKIDIEAEHVEVKEKGGGFSTLLRGLMIGGLIGAGWALLSTPQSGTETRNMLREKGIELRDLAVEKTQETRAKAEELTRQGVDRASEVRQRGEEVLNQQKTNLDSIVAGVKEGIRTYNEPDQGGEVANQPHTF